MSELFIEDYIKKITMLEKQIGAKTKYQILEPFTINSRDILEIQKAARNISDFIGLHDLTFIVAKSKQKEKVGAHIDLKYGEKEVFIEISDDIVEFENAVLATLAHEITHKYMNINNISCGTNLIHEYENEVFTDITSVFLGLGKLMLNGCEVKKTFMETKIDGTYKVTKVLNVGYLNRKQIAFVYRFVCAMRKTPYHNMISGLSTESISAIHFCDSYQLDYFNPQFHNQSYRSEIKETLMTDIRRLYQKLDQIKRHLDYIKEKYIFKTEEFIIEKEEIIASIINNLKSIERDDIYDPCLLFINTIEITKIIRELKREVEQIIFNATEIEQHLNNLTKSNQKEKLYKPRTKKPFLLRIFLRIFRQ